MRRSLIAAIAVLATSPAAAEVVSTAETGFVVRQAADVSSGADQVWDRLVKPAEWWSAKHTYSGDATNLSLDALAMGCFCEVLPSTVSPRAAPRGSVEHMRVVYAEQPRVLRLSGALGPLQAEAVQGSLTIALKSVEGGTRIMWEYVVGGYMRQKAEQMAPMVDAVLAEQLTRLTAKLGPKDTPAPDPAPLRRPPVEGR